MDEPGDEREDAPLLPKEATSATAPRGYDSLDADLLFSEVQDGTTEEHEDDLEVTLDEEQHSTPQLDSSDPASSDGVQTPKPKGPNVVCRVCAASITIDGKSRQHVVKCLLCNEATPIRAAPPGKKYVRCPCNCLLLCKVASNRIACPRPNCKRVITLSSVAAPSGTAIRAPSGTVRVECAYCTEVFMFNLHSGIVAKCPHCKKGSSVGRERARTRAIMLLIGFFITMVVLVFFMVVTWKGAQNVPVMYGVWLAFIVVAVFLFLRFLYFYLLKASAVIGPL